MTENQRFVLAECYRQLLRHGCSVDNDVTWLLVLGLIETYELIMRHPSELQREKIL